MTIPDRESTRGFSAKAAPSTTAGSVENRRRNQNATAAVANTK
jgi:hypothetical protein